MSTSHLCSPAAANAADSSVSSSSTAAGVGGFARSTFLLAFSLFFFGGGGAFRPNQSPSGFFAASRWHSRGAVARGEDEGTHTKAWVTAAEATNMATAFRRGMVVVGRRR